MFGTNNEKIQVSLITVYLLEVLDQSLHRLDFVALWFPESLDLLNLSWWATS